MIRQTQKRAFYVPRYSGYLQMDEAFTPTRAEQRSTPDAHGKPIAKDPLMKCDLSSLYRSIPDGSVRIESLCRSHTDLLLDFGACVRREEENLLVQTAQYLPRARDGFTQPCLCPLIQQSRYPTQ